MPRLDQTETRSQEPFHYPKSLPLKSSLPPKLWQFYCTYSQMNFIAALSGSSDIETIADIFMRSDLMYTLTQRKTSRYVARWEGLCQDFLCLFSDTECHWYTSHLTAQSLLCCSSPNCLLSNSSRQQLILCCPVPSTSPSVCRGEGSLWEGRRNRPGFVPSSPSGKHGTEGTPVGHRDIEGTWKGGSGGVLI